MSATEFDFSLGIGGAAGQGIATPGNILARLLCRQGLHIYAYNAYQSIVRGGHILLTMRTSSQKIHSHGDRLDMLVCLNQDSMDRHIDLMEPGTKVLFNSDTIKPAQADADVQMCPIPVGEMSGGSRNKVIQNVVSLGVISFMLGLDFQALGNTLTLQFERKGKDAVDENIRMARAGFEHAAAEFEPYPEPVPVGSIPFALWTGNEALAMGGAAAGVKFFVAYPMSPSTGVLHWMAKNAPDLGIMARQVEDEIAVANMAIGAAHAGCRSMCATSGGGFALMTEAIGAAAMMEIPTVLVNVQRAGPSTGVPTKTEQSDLWQALGASQGDFQRFIVAPKNALDGFNTIPELFNLCDTYQCPGIVITDLLNSEGTFSVDPNDINLQPKINRGEIITEPLNGNRYQRYKFTETGISPRAMPGLPGYEHIVATDEQDEDGVLISDEYTDPHKRRQMVEKRARKFKNVVEAIAPPEVEGTEDAEVTLIGWGSTYGVIKEAVVQLENKGVSANHLPIKWIVPFHASAVANAVMNAKRTIVVENNHSGQFFRYMRSEIGLDVDGHIRKYDGEPFMPHQIVDGVIEQLSGRTNHYVPAHEITV